MAAPYRPFPRVSRAAQIAMRPLSGFEHVGRWLMFLAEVLFYLPKTVRSYRRQTARSLNSLAWGRGALIVDGGVVITLLLLGIAIGAATAIEAYAVLDLVGFGPLTGVVGGLVNVREMTPILTAVGFAVQAGSRMTAEIGVMRISEEIDALEAIGIRPIPFVVGTRLTAGIAIVVPAYLLTLLLSFIVCRVVATVINPLPTGTYDHYFGQFVDFSSIAQSTLKAVILTSAVIVIHCYFGFHATGGPEGVGIASGRAIRLSLIATVVIDLMLTVLFWGVAPTYTFTG